MLQMFVGRLSAVTAVPIAAAQGSAADAPTPMVVTVRFLEDTLLAIDRRPARLDQPAHGQRARRPARRPRVRHRRRQDRSDRALRLDAEAARRRDPQQRGSVPRHRARRLCAARRPGAALHAPDRRDHHRGRKAAALSGAARSAVRPAEPQLLQRAAGDDHQRGQAGRRCRRRCSTSTSTISRTSTTRSAIRSATS